MSAQMLPSFTRISGADMQLITSAAVEDYLREDPILRILHDCSRPGDESLTCQRWLLDGPVKRLVFHMLYGDLLRGPRRKVLDVGGGLTSATRLLASIHDYTLIDLMAHDPWPACRSLVDPEHSARIIASDWYSVVIDETFDVVIANDLFPNVDQRLDLFLRKFLPRSAELRLALTYYNEPRFYITKRVDADEVLCMLAWDGAATARCLSKYATRIGNADLDLLSMSFSSPYANRRQVCVANMQGDRSDAIPS
jgi:hypothetical protein